MLFDRADTEERQRVIACYRALADAYGETGYPTSRAALDFQEESMGRLDTFPRGMRRHQAGARP